MSLRKTSLPSVSWPSGSDLEVEVHRAGEGVGDDERRAREVVHLDVGVDAALEVAVAREHRGDGEVVVVDRRGDLLDERARVADAGRAAVADEVEAELLEVGPHAGLLVVVGDDLGARGQRGLDPRLDRQALLDGVPGEQGGRQHDRRVGRVGARRDRGDRDGAVVELELAALGVGDRDLLRRAAADVAGVGRAGRRRSCPRRCPRGGSEAGKDSAAPGVALVVRDVGRRGPCGRRPWRRSARCGPADASGRRSTGRPSRGRARGTR